MWYFLFSPSSLIPLYVGLNRCCNQWQVFALGQICLLRGDGVHAMWWSLFIAPWREEGFRSTTWTPAPCCLDLTWLLDLCWQLRLAREAFHYFLEYFLKSLQGLSDINLLVSSRVSWWLVCSTTFPVSKVGGSFSSPTHLTVQSQLWDVDLSIL